MQKIDSGLLIIEIEQRHVRVRCKENGVEVVVEAIGPGLLAHGGGKQAYESVGRDHSLLVVNRLSMGMSPVLELAPR